MRILIILRQPLPNFRGGGADDGIEVGIVVGLTAKYFNAQSPFFQFSWMAGEGLLHGITQ